MLLELKRMKDGCVSGLGIWFDGSQAASVLSDVYRLLFVCLISSWHRIPWFAYFEPTLLYQKNLFLVFSFFHNRREKQCSWKDFATSFRSRPLLVPDTLGLHE